MSDRLRISGLCADRGQFRMQRDGIALVFALIEQSGGIPYLACQCFGEGPAAHVAASNAAHRLKRGQQVVVHASGLVLDRWEGRQVLRTLGPVQIEPPPMVARHEPHSSTSEAALAA